MRNLKVIVTLAAVVLSGIASAHEVSSVYVGELGLEQLTISRPTSYNGLRGRSFELSENELAGMQGMYMAAIEKAVVKHDEYEIATDAESADIVIDAELLQINPLAPKDDFSSRSVGEEYYSRGAGSAKIRFTVTDSYGQETVIEDRSDAGSFWGENDRFNNTRDVKRMFSSWGSYIIKKINKL